jgi:hypothetical protein
VVGKGSTFTVELPAVAPAIVRELDVAS